MTGDDLGIAHVPTPVDTRDLIVLERGEYRVLDVIPLEDEQSLLHALVRGSQPAHVRPRSLPETSRPKNPQPGESAEDPPRVLFVG
jgi:hypothetical protein